MTLSIRQVSNTDRLQTLSILEFEKAKILKDDLAYSKQH